MVQPLTVNRVSDASTLPTQLPENTNGSPTGGVLQSLQNVEQFIDRLMLNWLNDEAVLQSRQTKRVKFARQMAIAPLDEATLQPTDSMRRVTGCDISRGGISFQHKKPLPFRMVAVSIPIHPSNGNDLVETAILKLKWCRFTRAGIYHSGGQFLRVQPFGWERSLDVDCLPVG